MCCSPAVTRFGTRRSSRRAGSTRCSSGPSPTSERSPMPHPSASPASRTAWRRSCGPIWSPSPTCPSGSGRGRALSGTSPGRTCRWCWIPRCCWRERIGRPQPGTEARAGAISSAIASAAPTPWHPISAAWRRRRGCGGAAVRRTPEGPPQGPLHSQRRSGGVSGSVPGCRLCVHQLLPRNGVLRPVPKALLYGGGTGRDGCAGEFPDLQPVEPPGTGGCGSSAREIPRT